MSVDTDAQSALRETVRRYARERLLPSYQAREKEGRIYPALLEEMAALGILGTDYPEAYGGLGVDAVTSGIIIEELAYGDFNVASIAVVQSLCGAIVAKNGSAQLCEEWLPRIAQGKAMLGLSITEPGSGSDAAALRLRATRDGSDYILDGEKTSTTFADCAQGLIVFARVGQTTGSAGITALLVPTDSPGLTTTRFDDVGSRMSGRGSVFFDSVRVPTANLLGAEGRGFKEVMAGFDYSRALIALQCIGAAQASIDETWAYACERQAFGKPIAQYQGVTFPIVDYETRLAGGRQLAYHTLVLRDAGQPHTVEAAMVKSYCPRTAFDAIHQCILTFGHYGWSMDLPHQQRLRDVMGLEIGDGTDSIMKLLVSRARTARTSA